MWRLCLSALPHSFLLLRLQIHETPSAAAPRGSARQKLSHTGRLRAALAPALLPPTPPLPLLLPLLVLLLPLTFTMYRARVALVSRTSTGSTASSRALTSSWTTSAAQSATQPAILFATVLRRERRAVAQRSFEPSVSLARGRTSGTITPSALVRLLVTTALQLKPMLLQASERSLKRAW